MLYFWWVAVCVSWIISYFLNKRKNPLKLKKQNLPTWIFLISAFFSWMYNDESLFKFSAIFLIIFLFFNNDN